MNAVYVSNYSLYHHGILGQKWGVQNGPPYPLDEKDHNASERKAGWKKSLEGGTKAAVAAKKAEYKLAGKAVRKNNTLQNKSKYTWARKAIKDEKAKVKINKKAEKGKTFTKHQKKLIDKYLAKGMSEEEAQIAAYRRSRMEKALVIAGAVTLTAAAAYVGKKYYDNSVDKVLKSGLEMKRITPDDTNSVRDVYYAALAKNKGDVRKYEGMYAKQGLSGLGTGKQWDKVYQKTLSLEKQAKIASPKSQQKIISEALNKDKDLQAEVRFLAKGQAQLQRMFGRNTKLSKMTIKAASDLNADKTDTKAVAEFTNYVLPGLSSDKKSALIETFKNKGYAGMMDINDKKFSGYNAKLPLIMFNKDNVAVKAIREVGEKEILRKADKEIGKTMIKESLKSLGAATAVYASFPIASASLAKTAIKKSNDKFVKQYREKHPNSKLSYNEILKSNNRFSGE